MDRIHIDVQTYRTADYERVKVTLKRDPTIYAYEEVKKGELREKAVERAYERIKKGLV